MSLKALRLFVLPVAIFISFNSFSKILTAENMCDDVLPPFQKNLEKKCGKKKKGQGRAGELHQCAYKLYLDATKKPLGDCRQRIEEAFMDFDKASGPL